MLLRPQRLELMASPSLSSLSSMAPVQLITTWIYGLFSVLRDRLVPTLPLPYAQGSLVSEILALARTRSVLSCWFRDSRLFPFVLARIATTQTPSQSGLAARKCVHGSVTRL